MPEKQSINLQHFCYHSYSKPGFRSLGFHPHQTLADTVTLGLSFLADHMRRLAWLIPEAPEVP